MSEDWDSARYAREKRNFIESRLRFRFVYFHAALLFTVTWLAGWFCSFLLLKFGMGNLAGRYAASFLLAYFVFLLTVRVWADYMRDDRQSTAWDGGFDAPTGADGEGCAVVLVALVLGVLLASLFSLAGGLPLLLEAAFEVVFAGVVVRRMSRKETVGAWASRLVANTWLPALVALLLLTGLAAWLQAQAPGTRTFAEAVRIVFTRF